MVKEFEVEGQENDMWGCENEVPNRPHFSPSELIQQMGYHLPKLTAGAVQSRVYRMKKAGHITVLYDVCGDKCRFPREDVVRVLFGKTVAT